jgi:cytochrome c oxidase cbb3-type subunit III
LNSRDIPMRQLSPGCRRHGILLALLAALAAGCNFPGQPKTGDRYVPPQKERSFKVLFQQNCVGCHGAKGELGPAPPLSDKLFLALIPDTELQRVITEGRPGTLMPAFATGKGGHLTADQVKVLANGIKQRWGAVESAPSGAPPYLLARERPDGVGAGNKEEGLMVFARACASCHGDHGQGGKHGDQSVGAINDPDFRALVSDQILRRFVITGRPDLGMPNYADATGRPKGFTPLTSQEVTNVAALLAGWRQVGSGADKGN